MIEHIRIDSPPLIKARQLLNLGRVNILTGRNSSGKSTILKVIASNPDYGITYHQTPELRSMLKNTVPPNYAEPSLAQFDEWIDFIVKDLENLIFFNSSKREIEGLIANAKNRASLRHYDVSNIASQFTNTILSLASNKEKAMILSPKRRLSYQAEATTSPQYESEALNSLSRLFFLKNQTPDSEERTIYDLVLDSFTKMTGMEFDIMVLPNALPLRIQLQFRRLNGLWISAQDEGLGLTELLTIILYSIDGDHQLLLLEEPESHLHPDFQRRLLSFLHSIEDKQFILSTHSPVFLNPTMVDRIYLSKFVDNEIKIEDDPKRSDALLQIGVLAIDNLTSDAVVISEGKTDIIIIEHIVRHLLGAPVNASISHVFLSGSMMAYFDPNPFAQIRNTFALLDCDPKNRDPQVKFIEACKCAGIKTAQLKRYSIENYYSLAALRAAFPKLISDAIQELDTSIPVWNQLADSVHDINWWKGELKSARRIPRILKNMAINDLKDTDLLSFCENIKSVL
jgi:AAA15 family ATPase/GTPase